MTNTMLENIDALLETEAFIEELKAEAETLRNAIKEEMIAKNTEEMIVGTHIVRFTSISSSRFDTKRFKENFGDAVYKAYCKEVASRRFTIV